MEDRLTEKHIVDNIDCGYKIKKDTCEDGIIQGWNKTDAINKLGKLEDIEEEFGIDLITLSKLKKNGGYFKIHNEVFFVKGEDIYLNFYTFEKDIVIKIDFLIEKVGSWNTSALRYGKTWALTKEELEK